MKPSEFMESLRDPKFVGQSEYHILHEHLCNIKDSGDDNEETLELMRYSLSEVISLAQWLKREIPRKGKRARIKSTTPASGT